MKKKGKVISVLLACMMVITAFGGTSAFAESTKYLNFYPTGERSVNVNAQDYFQVLSSAPEPPVVKVEDTAKLQIEFDKQVGDATLKTYQYRYKGLKAGNTTVTVTSKDNLTAKETFTVKAADASSETAKSTKIKCDTNGILTLNPEKSYTLKISATDKNGKSLKPTITVGNGKVLALQYVKHVGNDYYYKITAIGKTGQETGVYSAAGELKPERQFKVLIKEPEKKTSGNTEKVSVKCDTTGEFGLAKGASYTFKITAPKGIVPIFSVGTKSIFSHELVKKSGNTYYYKITAIGKPGQDSGIYTTIPSQKPVKQCKVTIAVG